MSLQSSLEGFSPGFVGEEVLGERRIGELVLFSASTCASRALTIISTNSSGFSTCTDMNTDTDDAHRHTERLNQVVMPTRMYACKHRSCTNMMFCAYYECRCTLVPGVKAPLLMRARTHNVTHTRIPYAHAHTDYMNARTSINICTSTYPFMRVHAHMNL